MQVIVEVCSKRMKNYEEVIEVHARRLLDWRKAGKSGRLLDDKHVGDKRIIVREFVVDVDDFTDKDIADYKQVLKDNDMDEGFAEASAKAQDHHRPI